ncbi:LytR C-terminal domain-containing protein [Patescibacteria group bacterium]|nr:LytR C-terminal domain-containing protein [Patescibacteria group bacterium]
MPKKLKKNALNLLIGVFSIFLLLVFVYSFVLPSVFMSDKEIQNILLVSDNLDEQNNHISLVHLSPKTDDNLIIFFDGNQIIKINDEYGDYNLNLIYQLLKIDKRNDQKIRSVFSHIFKIAIDEVVVINGMSGDLKTNDLKNIFAKNLTKRISDSIGNKINTFKLFSLANSLEIIKLDQVSDIKKSYHKLVTIEKESFQNCSVAVVNTTDKTDLAKNISELLENTGAQVVQIESISSSIDRTIVYYPKDKLECKDLIERILGVFSEVPDIKSSTEIPVTLQFRSSVVVMVGKDY